MSHDCGCGRPAAPVPAPLDNRPGLPALRYRAGTHATFLQALLEGISTVTVPVGEPPGQAETRPLAGLSVRSTDDPSVALLDAWATLADVLTFYQERIANEGYLRTATERRSLIELARLTGYRPRPGVAASVHLAFDLDDGYRLELPEGTRAMSVPAPGETMQAFETREALQARAEWNRLVPRASLPALLLPAGRHCELWLQGITTGVAAGDRLLLDFGGTPFLHQVTEVHPDPLADRTRVALYCAPAQEIVKEFAHARQGEHRLQVREERTWTAAEEAGGEHAVATASVVAVLESTSRALASSRVRGGTAESRAVAAEAKTLSQAGDTVAIADVQRAYTTVSKAFDTVAGRNATLDQTLDQAKAELSQVMQVHATQPAPATAPSAVASPSYTPGGPTASDPKLARPAPALPEAGTEWPDVVAVTRDLTGLSAVLQNTKVYAEASRPPAHASRLVRTHVQALAAGTAPAANLLAALNPRLGTNLYRAWSGYRAPQRDDVQPGSVYVFRAKAAPFGATAPPPPPSLNENCVAYPPSTDWALDEDFNTEQGSTRLTLDGVYDRIVPGSWIAIRSAQAGTEQFFKVMRAETIARASYGLGGRATQLTLDAAWLPTPTTTTTHRGQLDVLRDLTVYAQAEPLPLARQPVTEDVTGDEIELDALYDGLAPGRWIIVSGERTDLAGVTASELAMIAGVRHGTALIQIGGAGSGGSGGYDRYDRYDEYDGDDGYHGYDADDGYDGYDGDDGQTREVALPGDHVHTWITLATPLAFRYRRSTIQIFGNVAAATHGETREQVLGSGDAGRALQRFELMQGPLTYVPAATVSGVESTLTVRVDRVRWDEAPHLAALGPHDREYLVRADHEDRTRVTFGDGVSGARLPTGHENVRAVYRTGIGAPGNVGAGAISLLATRPQGLKSVVNPLAAAGGGDPDTAEQIRRNAPLGLLSLERIVSVEDYTDFVRAFAGIGKARAAFLTDGRRPVVHITFAGVGDAPISDDSALATLLQDALRRYGDPHRYLMAGPRDLRALVVSARVRVRPDVLWEDVEPVARAELLGHFGFDRRELGQGVAASEVVGVLQGVWGVEAVDLELLASIGEEELRQDPDALAKLADPSRADDDVEADRRGARADEAGWVRHPWVPSHLARVERGDGGKRRIRPAQLVILTPGVPDTLILTEWKR